MILGSHGILGVVFGTTLGMTHSGITHIVYILDIIHTLHIDHIHTNHIHITHTTHLITLTTLAQILIMVQTIITMVLKMHIAETIIVMATQEATMYAQVLIQETQMAMQHALQTTTIKIEMQAQM